ncbi:hypothetical protein FJZ18_01505 [Candidatus Pacearchaeota archaeon]|nr:hypothetical protein [Candidatus Pacearchaeota archaeon]
MVSKLLGYVIVALGIIGLASTSFPPIRNYLSLSASMSSTVIMPLSLIVTIIGAVLVYLAGKGQKKGTEVPIYEGKKVVGYRRI